MGPSNVTIDLLPNLADKKATFLERTHRQTATTTTTNQPTNKPNNKPTKNERTKGRKEERRKQTNKPTNLLLPFPPKKRQLYGLHVVQNPSSRTPPTIHHLHLALPSARMAAKAPPEAWICSTSLQGAALATQVVGFNHQKSIKKSTVSTMVSGPKIR